LTQIVEAILQNGFADLEVPGGHFGSAALQVAAYKGQRDVVKLLIKAGADLWSIDRGSSQSAWFWIADNGWSDIMADEHSVTSNGSSR